MAFRFKQGDPVFHKKVQGLNSIEGLYTVQKVSLDGMIYRLIDSRLDYTDANESELQPVVYSVFIRIPEGWPIIIPVYLDKMYNAYRANNERWKFICHGNIAECAEEQIKIWNKLEQEQSK
jgi:hypothetical protein